MFEIRLIAGSQETVLVFIKTVCEKGRVFRANKLGDEVEIGALFVLEMEGLLQLEYPRWVM